MAKPIAAVKARQNLGQLLDDVGLAGAEYVIERDGKPTAAVIPLAGYQRYLEARQDAFDRIDPLKEQLAQAGAIPDLEALTEDAVRDVRRKQAQPSRARRPRNQPSR